MTGLGLSPSAILPGPWYTSACIEIWPFLCDGRRVDSELRLKHQARLDDVLTGDGVSRRCYRRYASGGRRRRKHGRLVRKVGGRVAPDTGLGEDRVVDDDGQIRQQLEPLSLDEPGGAGRDLLNRLRTG